MPSEVSRNSDTTSVLSSDSDSRRMVLRGNTSSIFSSSEWEKFTASSAGASASRTARSQWAKYIWNRGRSRTSLKLIEAMYFSPSTAASTQEAFLGLISEGLRKRRSMSQRGSGRRDVQGVRIQVAGGDKPSAPPDWTKVT